MVSGVDTSYLVELEIKETPSHSQARRFLGKLLAAGDTLALAPQVLAEFIHVVSDARRFGRPLSVADAIARADFWWRAEEVRQVFPSSRSTALFLDWMRQHRLGRKRLLDTKLAATYLAADVPRILSTNARDFSLFDGVIAVDPTI